MEQDESDSTVLILQVDDQGKQQQFSFENDLQGVWVDYPLNSANIARSSNQSFISYLIYISLILYCVELSLGSVKWMKASLITAL